MRNTFCYIMMATKSLGNKISQLHYNVMGLSSYMWSIVDLVMQDMTVVGVKTIVVIRVSG